MRMQSLIAGSRARRRDRGAEERKALEALAVRAP